MNVVASRPFEFAGRQSSLTRPPAWPRIWTVTLDVLLYAGKLAMPLPGPTGAPTMQNRHMPNLPSPKLGQNLNAMPQVVKSQHFRAF